jgi:hypothetical protein
MTKRNREYFRFPDLTGEKYGRLTILSMYRDDKNKPIARCLCDCGVEKEISVYMLRNGDARSCGCLNFENNGMYKHGYAGTLTYVCWSSIIQRCNNPNNVRYKRYGGRGIKICERWNKFENFLEDMGEKPDKMSIDRINNDDGYYKENCKWSTTKEQSLNRENTIYVTYNGEEKRLVDLVEELGLDYSTIKSRIRQQHWSIEDAISKPVDITHRRKDKRNQTTLEVE